MLDFQSILTAYGFGIVDEEMQSTIAGFAHDFSNALLSTPTIFNVAKSRIQRQPDSLNALLRCDLVYSELNQRDCLEHFFNIWFSEIRYDHPVREVIDIRNTGKIVSVQILVVGHRTAITALCRLTPE
ncbi:hypothetical protein AB4876_05550 [Zhongshania guokunii]|uniref:Uncharacterized protein n=1 Tax=Zhongshania guokunii TaxID=641783 RepID=A0ABV3U4H9_9GAMM